MGLTPMTPTPPRPPFAELAAPAVVVDQGRVAAVRGDDPSARPEENR